MSNVGQKIKKFLNENYLDSRFPFEYKVYIIFAVSTYISLLVAAVTNTLLYDSLLLNVPQWCYFVLCTVFLLVKPEIRMALQRGHILFQCFAYIPFIFFLTGGYDGTALLFTPICILVLTLSFSGVRRVVYIAINIAIFAGMIVANYAFPQLALPFDSLETRVTDMIVTMVLAAFMTAAITMQITKTFQEKNVELHELSLRDSLTGAYNRRFLFDSLEKSFENGESSCLLILDLDYFKRINDGYGHDVGDQVLLAFVQCLKEVLRESDVLTRYGGEEFIVLLKRATPASAQAVAERARAAVSELVFEQGFGLTVSIGVAFTIPGDTPESLIKKADSCLYEAKENGRNQVRVFHGELSA